jgi:hypothetical protein
MSPPTTGSPSNAAYVSPILILSRDTTPAKLEVVELVFYVPGELSE